MSVVTFFSTDKVETSQTTSMSVIATYLSVEKNYKILLINTKRNDISLQECFWDRSKIVKSKNILELGINGLIKAITSNKISPEIITNYTRTIFKGRLELLTSSSLTEEDYEKQKPFLRNIIKLASKCYDLVFVDLEGSLEDPHIQNILNESNLIVVSTSQRIKIIENFLNERKKYNVADNKKTIVLIGKYDRFSKYNIKNLQRMSKMQDIYGLPYNTLFFEACNEGSLAEYTIKYKKAKGANVQAPLMESVSELSNAIVDKLKKIQMQG